MGKKRRKKRVLKPHNVKNETTMKYNLDITSYKHVKDEILQSTWHKNNWDVAYVGTSKDSGERIYIHYDGTPYSGKRNSINYSISDQVTVEEYSIRYTENVIELQKLIDDVIKGDIWEPEDENMSEYVTYDFTYPNGKVGDIDYYIATEYGAVERVDALTYHVKMLTNYKGQLALLMFWYNGGAFDENFSERRFYELSSFLTTYNKAHRLRKLCDTFAALGPFQYHPLREKGRDVAHEYIATIRRKRQEIYSNLIAKNKISSKWVSEQKMYTIIRDEFPNALYQYKADWLGLQSIDVYVPDKKIAFEYQGVQHYEPVSMFGGDEGLKENQRRDWEKKEKCEANGVTLIEWKYDFPINKENLFKLLEDIL